MRIRIIGAGALGQAFARRLVAAGIEGVISNSRGPESLAKLVDAIGSPLDAGTLEEAVKPEIVLLAVPWARLADVLADVPGWEGRILIDPTNPTEPLDLTSADGSERTSSEFVAGLADGAHLVKAFNTLPARILAADPHEAGGRRVIFYAGDHARSNIEVGRLIDRLGFAGIDLGSLAKGGKLHELPGGPLANLNLVKLG